MGPHPHHLHRAVLKASRDWSHELAPLRPPFPRWYNVHTRCDYHGGNPGHPTKNCIALKYKVRDLINDGKLKFEDLDRLVEIEDSSRTKVEMTR